MELWVSVEGKVALIARASSGISRAMEIELIKMVLMLLLIIFILKMGQGVALKQLKKLVESIYY